MAGDASWASVATLLHFDGANGAATFTDNAPTPSTYTAGGSAALSTAQSVFGGSSLSLDGSTKYLQTPADTKFQFGNGDFTVEARVRVNAFPSSGNAKLCGIWSDTSGIGQSWKCQVRSNGNMLFSYSTTGGNTINVLDAAGANPLSINTWYALCWMRKSNVLYFFVNGSPVYSVALTDTFYATTNAKLFEVGRDAAGNTEYLNAFVDELRVTKGVARYATAGYTPATSALPDGMGQVSGVVTDNSSAAAARTVRAYRRDTGALVAATTSNGATGAYSFYTPTLDELTVLALDSASTAPLYDDQCARVIPA